MDIPANAVSPTNLPTNIPSKMTFNPYKIMAIIAGSESL